MKRALALLLLLGCAPAGAEELLVFAAVSTASPLTELGARFEAARQVKVRFSFAASNDLVRQIVAGAPADVMLAANLAQMERLEKEGLVRPSDVVRLLSNQLVVAVPASSASTVAAPGDFAKVHRLVLADPYAVPLGVYSRKWLEAKGLWAKLEPKVIPALNARATLAAVEAGNADAAIVYRTDAALSKRVRVAFVVPREEGPDIVYPVARLAASKHASAGAFVEFLRGEEAAKVFARYGFGPAR